MCFVTSRCPYNLIKGELENAIFGDGKWLNGGEH